MDEPNNVRRREYLKLTGAGATASTLGLAGCLGNGDDGGNGDDEESAGSGDEEPTGTLATQVTDQPGDIGDFESCVVTIEGVWLKPAEEEPVDEEKDGKEEETEESDPKDEEVDDEREPDAADEEGGNNEDDDLENDDAGEGREYHAFDEPQQADLVDLQGENTQLVDERELPVRTYEFLQIDVSDVEGTLEDGGDVEVSTPGNAPLQFKESFEIREDEVTTFVADFVPVRRGRTGSYLIKPVAQGTKVLYGDEEYSLEDEDGTEDDETTDDETTE